jgi:hypothetical protein
MTKTVEQLYERVRYIYQQCSLLVKESLGSVPPTAGNVAIFCQSDEEFEEYSKVAELLVHPSDNPNQKYFQLVEPIVIEATGELPGTTLSWLYIRKPSPDSPKSGDVDYTLSQADYDKFKAEVSAGKIKDASIYVRPGWDMVEFRNSAYDGLPYAGVQEMQEKVRVRF